MDSKRIAGVVVVISILSAGGNYIPGVFLGWLFEQGPPGWLPMVGTAGTTLTLYTYANAIFGALFVIFLSVGFGYYGCTQLDLYYEYRQFFAVLVAGTTIPLISVWVIGIGAFGVGRLDGYSALVVTALVFRLFATISLPVIFGVFGGAALAYFSNDEHTPPASEDVDTGTVRLAN